MNGKEYQNLAMRTYDGNGTYRLKSFANTQDFYRKEPLLGMDAGGILNACLGLSGEVGEFNDMIKKWIFHEKELDVDHLEKECGDILWYIALMCNSFGWNMDEVMQMNIDKLQARYPNGFDINRANNRKKGDV